MPALRRFDLTASGFPLRIAGGYFIAALLWIFCSDSIVELLGLPEMLSRFIGTWKGVAFVCVTSAILFRFTLRWVRSVEAATAANFESTVEIVKRLATASEFRDDETGHHNFRIGLYSEIVARQLGFDDRSCMMMRHGAWLHDLGKIAVPDQILRKNGPLSENEWEIMRSHTTFGAAILADAHHPQIQMAQTIALTHHENWDGTGYPSKLRGKDIPLEGRIVAVCDVFDALTNARPYKEAWNDDSALLEIRKLSGTKFDPEVVAAFEARFEEIKEVRRVYVASNCAPIQSVSPVHVLARNYHSPSKQAESFPWIDAAEGLSKRVAVKGRAA